MKLSDTLHRRHSWLVCISSQSYYSLSTSTCSNELICAKGSTIPPYILHLDTHYQSVDEVLLKLTLLRNPKSLCLRQINLACLVQDAKKTVILEQFQTDEVVDFIASAPCLEFFFYSLFRCHGCDLFFSGKFSALEAIQNGHESTHG